MSVGISVSARSNKRKLLYVKVRVKMSVMNVMGHVCVVRSCCRWFRSMGDGVQWTRGPRLPRRPSVVTVHDVSISSHSLQRLCVHNQCFVVARRYVRWTSQTVCQCLDVHRQPYQYTRQLDTAAYVLRDDSQTLLIHRRSQDFVCGALFCQESWRLFFSRRPQRLSKSTSKSKPRSKNCPKN